MTRLDIGLAGRPLDNAIVDIVGGQSGITVGQSVTLPPGISQVEIRVHRVTAGRAVMVPLTVTDGCGAWSTFVGGGAGSF